MEQGLIIIYWGYGKGKTTAAIGLALRALGQGQRVLFMQFMKGEDWKTGEAKMLEQLQSVKKACDTECPVGHSVSHAVSNIEFCIVGKGWVRIMGDQKLITEHKEAAREGLEFVKREIAIDRRDNTKCSAEHLVLRAQWDVVILDEILSAVDAGLLKIEDVKELIKLKPESTHLVMTGHQEYPELVGLVDVVTNMEKIKHPYDKGVLAQKGIDY